MGANRNNVPKHRDRTFATHEKRIRVGQSLGGGSFAVDESGTSKLAQLLETSLRR